MKQVFKIVALVSLCSVMFAASTNWQSTNVAGKAKRTIPMALGAAYTHTLSGTSAITITVNATTGRSDLPQVMTLKNRGVAVSTVNAMVITNVAVGDVLVLQTERASEDVVVLDTTGINLGGDRTLSDPADKLFLFKRDASNLDEVGYYNNN